MAPETRTVDANNTDKNPQPSPTQAEIDAAHATTGWSAYDVWRSRVFTPRTGDDTPVTK